ncbi:MAG: hypothetical protein H0T66_14370 [Geodermatophilaceae bacterium]|nr:hypothetical protein [Geodermatophilaceae bacterium]
MSVRQGREAYDRSHAPYSRRDYDAATVKASAVERGRARHAAQKGNASARAALAAYAEDLAADDRATRQREAGEG